MVEVSLQDVKISLHRSFAVPVFFHRCLEGSMERGCCAPDIVQRYLQTPLPLTCSCSCSYGWYPSNRNSENTEACGGAGLTVVRPWADRSSVRAVGLATLSMMYTGSIAVVCSRIEAWRQPACEKARSSSSAPPHVCICHPINSSWFLRNGSVARDS